MATVNRKERERLRHREEILDVAEAVFAEKGYSGATVEDIARQSEFSVGTLYGFFDSKEQLYISLVSERFEQLAAELHKAMDQTDNLVEKVRIYIAKRAELTLKYAKFAKLYTRDRMNDRFTKSELWRVKVGPIWDDQIERLRMIFEQGRNEGCFRSDIDPWDIAITLTNMCDGYLYEWLMRDGKFNLKQKVDLCMTLLLKGIQA
ncbi:MAG: helix-turn-helix transcriptional regulator [Sedimentisphaerales bacterium]|nr:helix-turn-helix transcriptional regulator [Sedimentisphaerales bacterium]